MRTVRDIYAENNRCYKASIELCTTCNWRCRHCYLPQHDNKGFSTERLVRLFKDLRDLGVYDLEFTGGEIFTRSDCLYLIETARRMGFTMSLLSNASMLTPTDIQALARFQIEAFDCTIFSMDPAVHDSFVQREGALDAAIQNILQLKECGIDVKVKCILTKYNWDAYKDILSFCEQNKLKHLFTTYLFSRNDRDASPLNMQVSKNSLDEIIKATTDDNGYSYRGRSNEDYICNSTRYGMFISATGDVHPCGNHPWVIGNINEKLLNEIWIDNKYTYIKNLKYKDTIKCKNCNLKERCFNCSGINELEGRSLLGNNERDCYLSELRLKYFGSPN